MSILNPVKSTNFENFLSIIDETFGSHTQTINSRTVHYIDDAHSLGLALSSSYIYINNTIIYDTLDTIHKCNYIFSKDKNVLHVYFSNVSYGVTYSFALTAAKASNGKWNVFFKKYKSSADSQPTKLYYNTPETAYILHEPNLKSSAENSPYIISPYPDVYGGTLSELFRVDYLSGFDKQNPPVLVVGDTLYAVPPYPFPDSETAAFAIPIDPNDYE